MISRKFMAILLLVLAVLLIASIPVILFTPLLKTINGDTKTLAPLIALTYTPVAKVQAQAVLTPTGSPGTLTATEAYLLDADSGESALRRVRRGSRSYGQHNQNYDGSHCY